MTIEDFYAPYRRNIGVVLFNRDARVWLGRRVKDFSVLTEFGGKPNEFRWQFPQGGIDAEETLREAAFRELKEETGVTSATLLLLTPGWLHYDFPPDYKKKDWKGQRQKWAAMLFQGAESEIDLAADEKQEFDAWRWAELDEAPNLIVPFKRHVYLELVETLAPLRDFLRSLK